MSDKNEKDEATVEGSKKLKLSVTRMKKLRSGVQGGISHGSDHGGSMTWVHPQDYPTSGGISRKPWG